MTRRPILLAMVAAALAFAACSSHPEASIILKNAEVYTLEPDQPWAKAIAIEGNRILAVLGNDAEAARYTGPQTRILDLEGKFVVPGFIDGHTHFENAGAMINGVNLLTVADDAGLQKEVARVVKIVGKGEWITGGLWGAYEEWAQGAAGANDKKKQRWEPGRAAIDDLTADNPCFLSSFDSKLFLANTAALKAAGLETAGLPGMKLDRKGKPNGLISEGSPALKILRQAVKPKSEERLLNESRAGLAKLAEAGIVEIHDITDAEQTGRFAKLQSTGELTCRIWMRPDLSRGAELRDQGIRMGMNPVTHQREDYLRYGALKGYIDGIMGTHGALFFAPYNDQPGNFGHYRPHTSDDPKLLVPNMKKMDDLIRIGVAAGFVTNVHAIGDKGVALMLDAYEKLMQETGKTLEGFRVIHAQVIRPEDFARFKKLHVIAEVNPYHISDDMRWMEERIGRERCRGAYAFRSLLDNGAMLSFGSDWPGTSAAEYYMHPKYLLHAAVNRTTLKGEPEGGWFPEQKISMEEALKAYTINNAKAALEGELRGSLKAGKLADITVLDRNLMKIDPKRILETNVELTMVDGKIVYQRKP
jgi:predicted amidohydrolase YtcJ